MILIHIAINRNWDSALQYFRPVGARQLFQDTFEKLCIYPLALHVDYLPSSTFTFTSHVMNVET